MKHHFYKYHGTGNDFIIIDNRHDFFHKNDTNHVAHLCDRRFGIGADGLILLENHDECHFKMVYYNSDGNESSMCGNGGRCITHFAKFLGIIEENAAFEAIDGYHHSKINGDNVELQMQNVSLVEAHADHVILNTGSPHYVKLISNVSKLNINEEGSAIRYSKPFEQEGINVNFVEPSSSTDFAVRTYERGVEGETLSCGTGVTAVALAMHYIGETEKNHLNLKVEGGELQVRFTKNDGGYKDIWLIGPATQVFKGELEW